MTLLAFLSITHIPQSYSKLLNELPAYDALSAWFSYDGNTSRYFLIEYVIKIHYKDANISIKYICYISIKYRTHREIASVIFGLEFIQFGGKSSRKSCFLMSNMLLWINRNRPINYRQLVSNNAGPKYLDKGRHLKWVSRPYLRKEKVLRNEYQWYNFAVKNPPFMDF